MLTDLPSYKDLQHEWESVKNEHILSFFASEPDRVKDMTVSCGNVCLDFSKSQITAHTFSLLLALAEQANLRKAIDSMFTGEKINTTENRAALHTALRNMSEISVNVDGTDVMPEVRLVLDKIKDFSENVRNGNWKGATGKAITDVVNIGIGGSDLGPRMTVAALKKYGKKGLNVHFVSNVDGTDITEVLSALNPETTLFIISSKTFTTMETISNAKDAKAWLVSSLGEKAVAKHFVAVSTNTEEVAKFGIDTNNMFRFWDWVGGRYSLWSAIGLSIAVSIGFDNFKDMLQGAFAMDEHFRTAPFSKNLPVIMGLLGVWYSSFCGYSTYAILPYDEYLKDFPAFLQQLEMESNGKSVTKTGEKVDYPTSPILWGQAGTNGQHSFYQLIHQGTQVVPCDFIVPIISLNELGQHQNMLIANALAQAEALLKGKTVEQVEAEGTVKELVNHKVFQGNRPSNTILIDKITPYSLGMLIALYEHKTFTEGIIWDINSFDQWGVELGKQLAKVILSELENPKEKSNNLHDASTQSLINKVRETRKDLQA
jgi:glucose-6-phosphate isomerase